MILDTVREASVLAGFATEKSKSLQVVVMLRRVDMLCFHKG
jgi:hypothetical protein